MIISTIAMYLICILGIIIIGKIFIVPIKWIVKLILNSILGAIILLIINAVGGIFGLHIGINLITAAIVGILGIPGAILLILFSIFF